MESGEQGHYVGLNNYVLWRRNNAGGCTHSRRVYMIPHSFMCWDFCEPSGGFAVPQVEAPSDHCVCSLHSPVLVEHCFFLICMLCSYPNGA